MTSAVYETSAPGGNVLPRQSHVALACKVRSRSARQIMRSTAPGTGSMIAGPKKPRIATAP
jgi:hypothetical protein